MKVRGADKKANDQIRVNVALDIMGVQWKQLNKDNYYQGVTSGSTSLTVTTLPESVVCRSCDKMPVTEYYVWHLTGLNKDVERKKVSFAVLHTWLLKNNWNSSVWDSTTSPEQWLLTITEVPT